MFNFIKAEAKSLFLLCCKVEHNEIGFENSLFCGYPMGRLNVKSTIFIHFWTGRELLENFQSLQAKHCLG